MSNFTTFEIANDVVLRRYSSGHFELIASDEDVEMTLNASEVDRLALASPIVQRMIQALKTVRWFLTSNSQLDGVTEILTDIKHVLAEVNDDQTA